MPSAASTSTDKIIVDKSRSHRNKAVSKTVRTTRERLQTGQPNAGSFDREMLGLYVSAVMQGAIATPMYIIVVTGIGLYVMKDLNLLIWGLFGLAVNALTLILARKANAAEIPAVRVAVWRRRFLIAHTAMGLVWAIFAITDCRSCSGFSFDFFKGTALLIALATTAMASFMLRRALVATFLPVILALAGAAAIQREPVYVGLTAVMCAALCFLEFMTNRMHRANLHILSVQSEKDDLIAELEVAKSMSDEARRRAEEANLAKSRFLASMSHELRTPLNAILGFSEVMSSEVLGPLNNPAYKEYTDDIHRSGKHLLNLINEILDLSRIEAGKYDLNEDAVQLVDIAEDCIGMVQLRARSKNISIGEQFEPNMPSVWVDEKSMRQVTLNLLSNAVKFTPAGGEITVKVGWTAGGGQYLSIRDNGPGIPEEEIPIVLSAFGQGSIAIKSAEQGTGLGLPIVQAILAKHDGEFILRSKLREGTEVIAILPAKRVLQSLPAVEEAQPVERRRKSFA
ncbi:sensor histidine kinase [Ensifer soli]|uniref:sensor histidine kinase n=1 Tax=Ciceribacter sp. sgz301302 TaxID=3342379 RepID=UPI0035B8E2A7